MVKTSPLGDSLDAQFVPTTVDVEPKAGSDHLADFNGR